MQTTWMLHRNYSYICRTTRNVAT